MRLSKLYRLFNNPNAKILMGTLDYEDADDFTKWKIKAKMSKNFIESITPGICPKCYSSNTTSQKGGFVCLNCGETWTEEDSNFAQGMMPEDPDEGEAATFRKTKGSELLNE